MIGTHHLDQVGVCVRTIKEAEIEIKLLFRLVNIANYEVLSMKGRLDELEIMKGRIDELEKDMTRL